MTDERDFDLADLSAERERQAGIARARAAVNRGVEVNRAAGRFVCDCGAEISDARRAAMPNATRCIDCETFIERQSRKRA